MTETSPAPPAGAAPPAPAAHGPAHDPAHGLGHGRGSSVMRGVPLGGIVRGLMIVPVLAMSLAAVALILYGAAETWRFLAAFADRARPPAHDEVLLHAIEIVDLFLLATVVEVVSLGLFQLYFRPDLALPGWLRVATLDDLKSKLVGVTVTVLAVYVLGRLVTWDTGPDVAYLGVGAGAVIAALSYFLGTIERR